MTPQAGGKPLQYPANDPGAVALGELGKGVSRGWRGARRHRRLSTSVAQTKMDRAAADAAFPNATIPLTEQLKEETDPEKITALRGQYQTALESRRGDR